MPNPKPARGAYRFRRGVKSLVCFSALTCIRHSSAYPGDKAQQHNALKRMGPWGAKAVQQICACQHIYVQPRFIPLAFLVLRYILS